MFDNVTIYCYKELQTTIHNFSASNKLNRKGYGLVCKVSQHNYLSGLSCPLHVSRFYICLTVHNNFLLYVAKWIYGRLAAIKVLDASPK